MRKPKELTNILKEAKLESFVDLRIGDALETLQDVKPGIEFLLLDGWNNLNLPLIQLLEPKFAEVTTIITDNAGMAGAQAYLAYVRNHPNYLSSPLKTSKGSTEYSIYIKNI